MKKSVYLTPHIELYSVKIEQGFAVSDPIWGNGTPGAEIDENVYGNEL